MARLPKDDVFIDPTPCCAQQLSDEEMQLERGGYPVAQAFRVVVVIATATMAEP